MGRPKKALGMRPVIARGGTPPIRQNGSKNVAGRSTPEAKLPSVEPLPVENVVAEANSRTDPALAARVEETLSCLTLKRRRFLLNYLENGNARHSVMAAGYNCKSPQSATDVAKKLMVDPYVQHAYQALLKARGLSGAKLDAIHALHLARHSSPDSGDRDRSLRALALARKYGSATSALRGSPVRGTSVLSSGASLAEQLLDEMTPEELRCFATSGLWPARFAARLGRVPSGADPIGSDRDGAPEPDVGGPSPEPPRTPPTAPSAEPPASPARTAGSPPPRHPPGTRPEERIWPPPEPGDRRGADLLAEVERIGEAVVPRDWYNRDRRW